MNTSLFNALGYFLEVMRPFVVDVLKNHFPGEPWEGVLYAKLSLDKQRMWKISAENIAASGGDSKNLIDFNNLVSFAISFKEQVIQEVGGKQEANRFISYLQELQAARNKCQHYQELSSTEVEMAFGSMKMIAIMLELEDLKNEIERIQREESAIQQPTPVVTTPSRNAETSVPVRALSDNVPAWFNNAIPHYDIRNVRLDESVFAANLSEVALETGPDVYTNPSLFFAKTFVTDGLRDISKRVVRALNGGEAENRVISLQTGFGGGKTHTLISLYHIVRSGRRLAGIANGSEILGDDVIPNFDDAKVVVFTNNTTDVSQGRDTIDGLKIYTLWGEIAYQLGGKEAYEKIRKNDEERIAPTASLIKPILESCKPGLILIDELADYCVKASGISVGSGTLFNQTNSFIQTLTEVVASVPKTVLIVTLPASATEVAASDIGQEVLSSLETRVVRVGTSVKPVDDEEIFEVVRRRLFERIIDVDVIDAVARKYQSMYHNRRGDLPAQADNVAYANKIRKSYPFHPELIDMFRLRWGNDSRFQRTRGVLRLLASIVQDLWRRKDNLGGSHALIHTSDVNLENLPTLTGTITNLMGSNWETVLHADIYGTASNACKLDALEPMSNIGQFRLTQGVATTILMASIGDLHHHGMNMEELKLCVLKPDAFNHNDVNGALNKLENVAHYLYSSTVGGKHYWFQSKANINILLNQAKNEVRSDEKDTEILRRLNAASSIRDYKVLVNPSSEIPEQKSLTLVILGPQYCVPLTDVDSNTLRFVKDIALKRGSSDRLYRNTIFYLACSEAGKAVLYSKLQDYLACNKILHDYASTLEPDQKADVEAKKREYNRTVDEALISAYSVLLRYSARDGISRRNICQIHSDFGVQLSLNVIKEIKEEEWLIDTIGRNTLANNGLLPTVDNPVQVCKLYEAFLRYDDKPMISGPEAIKETVLKYCSVGQFNVAVGTPGHYSRIFQNTRTIPFLDVNEEQYWLVDPSVVEDTPVVSSSGTGQQGASVGTVFCPSVPSTPEVTSVEDAVKEFRSVTISGRVPMENWPHLFSSFINVLKNNGLEIDVRIKAKAREGYPLNENSVTVKNVKESASQLGLKFEVEE